MVKFKTNTYDLGTIYQSYVNHRYKKIVVGYSVMCMAYLSINWGQHYSRCICNTNRQGGIL